MSVEIISKELNESVGFWLLRVEISQNGTSYALATSAPGSLEAGELQAYVDARENEYWSEAARRGKQADILADIEERRLIRALALVVLDEINVLRVRGGLVERTEAQLRAAIKAKLK